MPELSYVLILFVWCFYLLNIIPSSPTRLISWSIALNWRCQLIPINFPYFLLLISKIKFIIVCQSLSIEYITLNSDKCFTWKVNKTSYTVSKNRQQVQPCFLLYPFYIDLYFNTEGEDEDGETKEEVKIPLKINPKEGDSKLNTTYLIVRTIEHWDDNIELVLDNFPRIDDKMPKMIARQKSFTLTHSVLARQLMTPSRPSRNRPEMMSLFKSEAKSNGMQLQLRLKVKELWLPSSSPPIKTSTTSWTVTERPGGTRLTLQTYVISLILSNSLLTFSNCISNCIEGRS